MPMPTLPPQLLSSPSPLLSSRGNLLSPAPTSHRSQGAGVKVRVIDHVRRAGGRIEMDKSSSRAAVASELLRLEARAAGLHARLTPGTSEVSSISFSSICPLVFDLLQGGYFMVWAMGPGPPRHHRRRSYVWGAGLTTLFATSMFVFSHERPPSACDDSPNCMHEGAR